MASIQQVTVLSNTVPVSSTVLIQIFMGGPGGILANGPWQTVAGLTSLPGGPYDASNYLGKNQPLGGNGYSIALGGPDNGVGQATWHIFRSIPGPVGTQTVFNAPVTTSPNLDVNFDAWGSTIPLMMGHVRLGGKVTFAQGLEVGFSLAAKAFIDLEVSFGYPLDPNEWQWIECVAIWANGNKIFGGTDDLPGLSFTFYEGKEDSPVAPEVLADKGAARATGMRGMRRIVFKQFPIGVIGGGLPTFSAEFAMTKGAPAPLIKVADVIKNICNKSNVTLTTSSNFDDQAYGVVFMADVAPVALMRDLMATYNYTVKDGDGASLVRRPIGPSLAIDASLDVNDMITESPTEPAITFERKEQSEIANQISLQYTDIDLAFTNGIQYARRPIFPIREALSDNRTSIQLPFVLDAVTALQLDYDQLYRGWSEQLTLKFKSSNMLIEPGDVLAILGHELGDFIVRVTTSTLRFDSAVLNEITATAMLKRTGVTANADSGGNYITDTIIAALKYPDIIAKGSSSSFPYMGHPIIADGALSTTASILAPGVTYGTAFAPTSIPTAISRGAFVASNTPTPDGVNTAGPRLQDGSYVYVVDHARCGIQRISKSDIRNTQYLSLTSLCASLPANGNQFFVSGGYLYWGDKSPGSSGDRLKAYRLDLSLFTAAGLKTLPLDSDTITFTQVGAVAIDTVLLLTAFDRAANDSRLYVIDLTDASFGTYSYVSLTNGPAANQGFLGRGISAGGFAVFLPLEAHEGGRAWDDTSSNKDPQVWGAKIDPSSPGSSGGIVWFNITDDASVTFASKGDMQPWTDEVNIYFLANSNHQSPHVQFLAARKVSDLSVVTGFDLTTLYDDALFDFYQGISDGEFHYIIGSNDTDSAGAVIKVEQNLSAGVLFYRGRSQAPSNDDFANAAPITLNTTVNTTSVFATKEAGEPNHNGHTGGASIWYAYTAPPGKTTATIDASDTPIPLLMEIAVYTGTAVGALTPVAADEESLTFSTTPGQRYMIALDTATGIGGTVKFTFSG